MAGSRQEAWLTGRGISPTTTAYFKLGVVAFEDGREHAKRVGRISVPYLTQSGCRKIRYRGWDGDGPKILDAAGAEGMLYNVQALHGLDEVIWVAEGEPDVWTLHQLGLAVIGVSGAKAWKTHYRHLLAHREVRVAAHGDPAGQQLGHEIVKDVRHAVVVPLPDGQDANDLLQSGGEAAVKAALGIEEE